MSKKDYEELIYPGGSSLSPTDGLGPACTILKTQKSTIAVDCGLELPDSTPPDASILESGEKVNATLLTHVHTDHVGGLASCEEAGMFESDSILWASPQTNKMLPMVLNETWKKCGNSYESILKVLGRRQEIGLGEIEILPGQKAWVDSAGHANGAFFTIIRTPKGKNVAFMGDHAWHDQPTVLGSSFPDNIPDQWLPDIIAQTDLTDPRTTSFDYPLEESRLASHVGKCLEQGKMVFILAFRYGRAQNALLGLKNHGITNLYCDGSAVGVFDTIKDRWSDEDQIIDASNITMIEGQGQTAQRRSLFQAGGPFVVVTPSGMGDGGPAIQWLQMAMGCENAEIISVGWSSPGSTVAELQRKAQLRKENYTSQFITVKDEHNLFNEPIELRCGVSSFHLKGHSGVGETLKALTKIVKRRGKKLEKIVTTHGLQDSKRKCENILKDFADYVIAGNVGTRVPI